MIIKGKEKVFLKSFKCSCGKKVKIYVDIDYSGEAKNIVCPFCKREYEIKLRGKDNYSNLEYFILSPKGCCLEGE